MKRRERQDLHSLIPITNIPTYRTLELLPDVPHELHRPFKVVLQALGIVRVRVLASARRAASRTRPADSTALAGQSRALLTGDSDGGATAALVSFRGDDLIVESTQVHAQASPGVEVIRGGDRATGPLVLANGPVLVEGGRALDRRLVDLLVLVDVVGGSVTVDGAFVRHARARIVAAIVLEDVVFNQGVSGPSIHREVGISIGIEAPGKGNVPNNKFSTFLMFCIDLWRYIPVTARIPALAAGKVATVLIRPGHAILATGAVGVFH